MERGKEKTPSKKVDLAIFSRWKCRSDPSFDDAIIFHSNERNDNSEFDYDANGATLYSVIFLFWEYNLNV